MFWHWMLLLSNLTSAIILISFFFFKWYNLFAWISKWFSACLKTMALLRHVCFVGAGSNFPDIQCAFSIGRLRSCISGLFSVIIFSNMYAIPLFCLSSFGLCACVGYNLLVFYIYNFVSNPFDFFLYFALILLAFSTSFLPISYCAFHNICFPLCFLIIYSLYLILVFFPESWQLLFLFFLLLIMPSTSVVSSFLLLVLLFLLCSLPS